MQWFPKEIWKGADAFVVGGGPSLKGFDWELFRSHHVIGCNSVIQKGFEICEVCFFSDIVWFDDNYQMLYDFPGLVVTHCSSLASRSEGWIKYMSRKADGLHRDGLGFGGNSGVGAINLALLFGVKRVFLLGMDCTTGLEDEYHWADPKEKRDKNGQLEPKPTQSLFEKFKVGFESVRQDLPKVFPGRSIFNLNERSALRAFPFMSLSKALQQKTSKTSLKRPATA